MSHATHIRRARALTEQETSPLQPTPAPVIEGSLPATTASPGHSLGGFAIQRCGPVPCDCSEEERAEYEATNPPIEEHDYGSGHHAGRMAGAIQRDPDNALPPTDPNAGNANLGGNQSNNTTPLNAGANGSTTIHAPTMRYQSYSARTLTALDRQLPDEVGAVDFGFHVNPSGDPISSAVLDVTQIMTMPRWDQYDRQCPPVKQAWDSFYAALRSHEDGHVTIDNQQFAGQHARFIGQAQSDTQSVSNQLRSDVQAAQDVYDNGNDHGRQGNPPTILDTTVTCAPSGGARSDLGASDLGESVASDTTAETSETTQTMQTERVYGGDVSDTKRFPADEIITSVQSVLDSGSGQPLDELTRAFMEPRFGHNFREVRVHTDDGAARSAASVRAQAYTVGSDIVFGAGRFAPQSSEGRRLLAHELTHVVQQSAGPVAGVPLANGMTISDPSDGYEQAAEATAQRVMARGAADTAIASALDSDSAIVPSFAAIQRWTNPIYTLKSNTELIEDGSDGDVNAIMAIEDFNVATDAQRISMLTSLLDGYMSLSLPHVLERIWDSFGDRLATVATAHMDLWQKSADHGAELTDNVFGARVWALEFPDDVKEVVSSYLSSNQQLVEHELERLFDPQELVMLRIEQMGVSLDQAIETRDLSAERADAIHQLQIAATAVARLQKAQEDAYWIRVGRNHGTLMSPRGVEVYFDPFTPPEQSYTEESRRFFGAPSDRQSAIVVVPYATVKQKFDAATAAIAEWQRAYPDLYAISRQQNSASTTEFASATPTAARHMLGKAMLSLISDILRTQDMLANGDLNPLDMTPIHEQLFHGQLIGGVSGLSGTNWSDVLPNWIAKTVVSDHNFGNILKRLALETLKAAAYLLAPFTDGASLLAVIAISGYQMEQSEENYDRMAQAARTSVVPGTEIFSDRQVDAARRQADSDKTAFELDLLFSGISGAEVALNAITGPARGLDELARLDEQGAGVFGKETTLTTDKTAGTAEDIEQAGKQEATIGGGEAGERPGKAPEAPSSQDEIEVVAEEPLEDGHEAVVTKDHQFRICSEPPCSILRNEYRRQLDNGGQLLKDFEQLEKDEAAAAKLADEGAKKAAEKNIAKRLGDLRRELKKQALKDTAEGYTVNGVRYYPEGGLYGSGKHGIEWTEGPARAAKELKPQGKFGTLSDVDFAVERGTTLGPGNTGTFPLPPGHKCVIYMPNGDVNPATQVFVKVYEDGKIHAFPVP